MKEAVQDLKKAISNYYLTEVSKNYLVNNNIDYEIIGHSEGDTIIRVDGKIIKLY